MNYLPATMNKLSPARFLVAITAIASAGLCAVPAVSNAQNLYVANLSNAKVEEYDASTGAIVKNPLVKNTQSNQPTSLALWGNNLYVGEGGQIGEYNATTGAALGSGTLALLTFDAQYLAQSGSNLYATGQGYSYITEINASTGAIENSNLLGLSSNGYFGMAISGTNLYVAQGSDGNTVGSINEYNLSTGSLEDANLVDLASYGYEPQELVVSGSSLYLSYFDSSTGQGLAAFDASTGAAVPGFTSPSGMPTAPQGLAVYGNDLFATFDLGYLNEYNATTGALISGSFIMTGLAQAGPIVVSQVPEPSILPLLAVGLAVIVGMRRRGKKRIPDHQYFNTV